MVPQSNINPKLPVQEQMLTLKVKAILLSGAAPGKYTQEEEEIVLLPQIPLTLQRVTR